METLLWVACGKFPRLDYLEMGRRVEVLAGVSGAAALDEVHAHGDAVVVGVYARFVRWVAVPALVLAAAAVAAQIVPAHLVT